MAFKKIYRQYLTLPKPLLYLITAEFLIQLVNSSFLALQVIYMQSQGYSDKDSALYIALRFVGVVMLALPVGIFIKNKKLIPFFYTSALGVPIFGLLNIYYVYTHNDIALMTSQVLWGISFMLFQIPVLPFILRHSGAEKQTAAISLSYATYSFGGIVSGVIIYFLNMMDPVLFSEKNLLITFCFISLFSIYLISRVRINESPENYTEHPKRNYHYYEWRKIIKALTPTLIIAVGAGLTIPFIGIFFYNVHHMSVSIFGLISSVAAVLVAIGALLVPTIKEKLGYKIAIPTTQSFAIISLVLLATTQFYAHLSIAVWIAIFCYLLRQPLMNMAGPMTTELVMNYVGERNREITSALTSAIWSGSWFMSSLLYSHLRKSGFDYSYVFLITALLYILGVVWYYLLILDYERKVKAKKIPE